MADVYGPAVAHAYGPAVSHAYKPAVAEVYGPTSQSHNGHNGYSTTHRNRFHPQKVKEVYGPPAGSLPKLNQTQAHHLDDSEDELAAIQRITTTASHDQLQYALLQIVKRHHNHRNLPMFSQTNDLNTTKHVEPQTEDDDDAWTWHGATYSDAETSKTNGTISEDEVDEKPAADLKKLKYFVKYLKQNSRIRIIQALTQFARMHQENMEEFKRYLRPSEVDVDIQTMIIEEDERVKKWKKEKKIKKKEKESAQALKATLKSKQQGEEGANIE